MLKNGTKMITSCSIRRVGTGTRELLRLYGEYRRRELGQVSRTRELGQVSRTRELGQVNRTREHILI